MSKQKNDGGDKTEKPTAKRIKDARKEGDIHKSRELTSTVLVLAWLVMFWLLMPFVAARLQALFANIFLAIGQPSETALHAALIQAAGTLLWICAPLLLAACGIGLLVEFLQVGPIIAFQRLKPMVSRLNPAEGMKKIFSQENLVELIKSIVKTAALIGILVWVLFSMMDQFLLLPFGQPAAIAAAHWQGMLRICIWVAFIFFFVSAMDAFYQRFAYVRKLRMSRRDIRQELKDSEGDPYVKGRRRQLHQEWAQRNMLAAVRQSNVVVTNPTHIAVALTYEAGKTDLPIVAAKGEDYEAELIRKEAEQAGVPILQNIPLARGLHENIEVEDYITAEFFEAVAEVLRWAESMRNSRD
jgi:type III secretion protein U